MATESHPDANAISNFRIQFQNWISRQDNKECSTLIKKDQTFTVYKLTSYVDNSITYWDVCIGNSGVPCICVFLLGEERHLTFISKQFRFYKQYCCIFYSTAPTLLKSTRFSPQGELICETKQVTWLLVLYFDEAGQLQIRNSKLVVPNFEGAQGVIEHGFKGYFIDNPHPSFAPKEHNVASFDFCPSLLSPEETDVVERKEKEYMLPPLKLFAAPNRGNAIFGPCYCWFCNTIAPFSLELCPNMKKTLRKVQSLFSTEYQFYQRDADME